MKKPILLLLLFLLCVLQTNAQDLESVLNKHWEQLNIAAFKNVDDFVLKGSANQGGNELQVTIFKAKNNKFRQEVVFQGQTQIMAVNAEKGWMINPFSGDNTPVDMPESQFRRYSKSAKMMSPIYGYKERGETLEYLGQKDIYGSLKFELKLIDSHGETTLHYIDSQTYLQTHTVVKGPGGDIIVNYKDFKEVGGIPFAFTVEQSLPDNSKVMMSFTEVKLNQSLKDVLFEKPKG